MSDQSTRQQAHFDAIAKKYIDARRDKRHLLLKDLIWNDFFRSAKLDISKSPRVLEAMCGIGEGKFLLEKNLAVVSDWQGFDYSPNMVAAAQEVHGPDRVFQADATTFIPDRQYDVILIIGGLHHVHWKAREVVQNLSHALAPGGYFIAFEPTHANPVYKRVRDRIYAKSDFFDDETERAFHVKELWSFFADAGLVHERDLNFGLSAYTLYYNPDAFPLLNKGPEWIVKALWGVDRLFAHNAVGRFFSFATLTLWRKPQ
ncbi:MAG TPA: class I SAM-dependent methyltransferase [Devosia sp.]|nr:class I SAM-dependent methyltransferase [Devosia sp.]